MATGIIGHSIGGRYEVRGLLGQGGMAEVYEGIHPKLNRTVAIKLLHRHLSTDAEFQSRFEREAQAMARLKHNHIIQVYDFDRDEELNQYYMIMEYIDGPSLSDYIKQQSPGGLSIGESLRIITDIASALQYAHGEQMLHRDIKPSNVMLDKGKRTVLMDFGIAKLLQEGGSVLTASGAMVGTPAYMSPEIASGMPGDHRADIYSLGVMFYQMVTGRLPFQGDTPISTILKQIQEPLPQPTDFNPDIPPGVEAVLLRCLTKTPDDRYQNAGELLEHLNNLDVAASQLDVNRTMAGRVPQAVNRLAMPGTGATAATTPPYQTPASGITATGSLTDTLATAPRRTSLLIGVGALAIIALLALGAILFSSAGNTATDADATEAPDDVIEESILHTPSETDMSAHIAPELSNMWQVFASENNIDTQDMVDAHAIFTSIIGSEIEGQTVETAAELLNILAESRRGNPLLISLEPELIKYLGENELTFYEDLSPEVIIALADNNPEALLAMPNGVIRRILPEEVSGESGELCTFMVESYIQAYPIPVTSTPYEEQSPLIIPADSEVSVTAANEYAVILTDGEQTGWISRNRVPESCDLSSAASTDD